MDKNFVGFIFATYQGASCGIEAICFQSVRDADDKIERQILSFEIVPGHPKAYRFNLEERAAVPDILLREEHEEHDEAMSRLHTTSVVGIGTGHVQSKLVNGTCYYLLLTKLSSYLSPPPFLHPFLHRVSSNS